MPADPSRLKPKRRLSRKDGDEYMFNGGHAREVEQKRSRGEISCAECRRLKIKCDKQIPCQSCQRRGCATLCPNSSLETGQGTRFVLAATEHLHDRIAKMGTRIRNLEEALAELQAKHSTEPHPLLRDDLLSVNAEGDEEPAGADDMDTSVNTSDVFDALGTLSISDHGISRFFGPTGGSESLFMANDTKHRPLLPPARHNESNGRDTKTPPKSQFFSHSFPFTPTGPIAGVQATIESHLPPFERAYFLCERYFAEVAWVFRGVTKSQVYEDLLPTFYRDQDTYSPRDCGALVEDTLELSADEAEHYYQIAQAAVNLQPVLEKPSLVTVQTLRLWSVYNGINDVGETSMEMTWSLLTLAAHLSQTIGLHRDSAKWGLSPQMVHRRRVMFWDIFMSTVWQSLLTGRPPAFSLAYVDCNLPEVEPSQDQADETGEFDSLLYRFTSKCAAEVVSRTLTVDPPSYSTIMDLDRKVREFPLVKTGALASFASDPSDLTLSMRRMGMLQTREALLLYIHRSFFAQAIIDHPTNPLKSSYTPSFLAAYRSSATILQSLQETFSTWPKSCSRYWVIWTFAFSASIVFGVVVTRCPSSPLAMPAMKELEQACVLFSKAAVYGRRAAKSLPILLQLREKARNALSNARTHSTSPQADRILSNMKQEDTEDELGIFAGRTRFISAQRTTFPADSYPPQSAAQKYGSTSDYSRKSQSLSPLGSAISETHHQENVVPTSSPTRTWISEQPRDEYISTPDNYRAPNTISHFQSEQVYTPNVTWPQSHRQENTTPSFQPNSGAGSAAVYDLSPGAGSYRAQQHEMYSTPPDHGMSSQLSRPELVHLGFTAQEGSRFHERWTSFMHDTGILEGISEDYRRNV